MSLSLWIAGCQSGVCCYSFDRINKQWQVIALEQLTSHIERRPTTRWSYRRRIRSLLLWVYVCVQCVTSVVQAQLLPIVCWFYRSALGLILFQITLLTVKLLKLLSNIEHIWKVIKGLSLFKEGFHRQKCIGLHCYKWLRTVWTCAIFYVQAKEVEKTAIEEGIRENGTEDSDKVIQAVLAARHAQVRWLINWLIDWLIDWLVDQLIGGRLIGWSID